MMLPFARDQFMAVFAAYNQAIWPVQIPALAIGVAITIAILSLRRPGWGDRPIAAGLAAMWFWTGLSYHLVFFSKINPAAYFFSALFVIQALLLAWSVIRSRRYGFVARATARSRLGLFLIFYAIVLYPAIGLALGHRPQELPGFGVTPCPVTIFTFGVLLQAGRRLPAWLLIIPGVWSLIGGSAAFLLDIPQDWMLLASGLVATPLIAFMPANEAGDGGKRRARQGQQAGIAHDHRPRTMVTRKRR